jgi:hypothetical protein
VEEYHALTQAHTSLATDAAAVAAAALARTWTLRTPDTTDGSGYVLSPSALRPVCANARLCASGAYDDVACVRGMLAERWTARRQQDRSVLMRLQAETPAAAADRMAVTDTDADAAAGVLGPCVQYVCPGMGAPPLSTRT